MSANRDVSANQELSFEEAVTRLETIVAAMESGGLPLEDCLRRFEDAVALSRLCASKLESAEKQIYLLTGDTPAPALELDWTGSV